MSKQSRLGMTLILGLGLLMSTGNAWGQARSTIQLDSATPRSIVVEQLQSGTVAPAPIAPTPPPQYAQPMTPSYAGVAQEASLLMPVQFGFDSAELTPQARAILNIVAEAMNDPSLRHHRFLLEGHTDVSGSWQYNAQLSQRRANAAANYLVQRGVAQHRLMVVGYSWNRLLPGLVPTDARHRRVEIGRLQ